MIFIEREMDLRSLRNKNNCLYLYLQLILYRIQNPIGKNGVEYTEMHHIIPRCILKLLDMSDTKANRVRLTYEEHFMAHYYLVNIFPSIPEINLAFCLMCSTHPDYLTVEEASKSYAAAKILAYDQNKGKSYRERFGKKRSIEIKIKQGLKKLNTRIRIINN